MNISNINQMFNQKIQDINSRIPTDTNVSTKFQNLLEQAQLKNNSNITTTPSEKTTSTTVSDVDSLLKTMLSTQATLNSTSLFSDNSASGLFPTSSFNNSINMIQQAQLLNALKKQSLSVNDENKWKFWHILYWLNLPYVIFLIKSRRGR